MSSVPPDVPGEGPHSPDPVPDGVLTAIYALQDAEALFRARLRKKLGIAASELAAVQFLCRLESRGMTGRPVDVAAHLGISTSAVSPVVARLEGRGFVVRRPDPEDGRVADGAARRRPRRGRRRPPARPRGGRALGRGGSPPRRPARRAHHGIHGRGRARPARPDDLTRTRARDRARAARTTSSAGPCPSWPAHGGDDADAVMRQGVGTTSSCVRDEPPPHLVSSVAATCGRSRVSPTGVQDRRGPGELR
jgi:hypothetical protein